MVKILITVKKFNENQQQAIKNNLVTENYEWDNKTLISYLMGKVPLERELYRYSGKELTKEQLAQNKLIHQINDILQEYNNSMNLESQRLIELENLYKQLDIYIERYMTSYYEIKKQLKFNTTFLLSGPGGIGKTQFLYEFSNEINKNIDYLIIYGKYCNCIGKDIFDEINEIVKTRKFYFIIDAINELNKKTRDDLLNFINNNKSGKLRVIMSYRNYSIDENEIVNIKNMIDEEEIFTGVSADDALEKISEKYNLDLSIYSRLLYDNNPLHLKMIINSINDNQLKNKKLKPVTKGTYIYEHFIKKVLSANEWKITKKIVKKMLENQEKNIKYTDAKLIAGKGITSYISKMKKSNFLDTYFSDNEEYLYFINETLTDYLIARMLFEEISDMTVVDIIKYINKIVTVFYSIHIPIILMLFEKYDKKIEVAMKIIQESELFRYFDLEVLNEIAISDRNMKKIVNILTINNNINDIFKIAGGNETNPFNCSNYLNEKLFLFFERNQFNFNKYEKIAIRNKLKLFVQTISKFDYDKKYLDEKFWFGVWSSSFVDKTIRGLAKKLIFEIANDNSDYIKILIKVYKKINDDYIKEAIIQILCSLKKENETIIKFLNQINNRKMISINNLYYIDDYLYNQENYVKYNKINLINYRDKSKNNDIYKFLRRVFFTNKYDYDFFGLDIYNNSMHFSTTFLEENKKKIICINEYIDKNFKCLNKYECCNSYYFKELFIDNKYLINYKQLDFMKIYLAWQSTFKRYLKKYKVKIKDLKNTFAYEEIEKGLAFKALDLSLLEIIGSISCNYFTTSFEVYGNYKGFQQNWFNSYNEKSELFYPISVFNEKIESLDKKILKKIKLPEKKDLKWVNDDKMALENVLKLVNPIKINNEEWYLIYGYIRKDEKSNNKYENAWIDTYIINLAVNESYNLSFDNDEDRFYTIETKTYRGNLNDAQNQDYSQSSSLNNSSDFRDLFITTDFNIPPTNIIKEFNLHYNKFNTSWDTDNKEVVVLVNNNKGSWYKSGCTGSIYLKKKYYELIQQKYNCKYFCFTEKFHPKTGYSNESALQIQINSDNTIISYKHYKKGLTRTNKNENCKNCIIYQKNKENLKHLSKSKFAQFVDDLL